MSESHFLYFTISNDKIRIHSLARRGPRVNAWREYFENLACGASGKPRTYVSADKELLLAYPEAEHFWAIYELLCGTFNRHYLASVPGIVEFECCLGFVLLKYLQDKPNSTLYTLGSGSGTFARTIGCIASGAVSTMSCSVTKGNSNYFSHHYCSTHSHFFLGSFIDFSDAYFAKSIPKPFHNGFDCIIEETTFQMFHKERTAPIALVKEMLKPDGVLFLIEKCLQADDILYDNNEASKARYKKLYFTEEQIAEKKEVVLADMESMMIKCDELIESAQAEFKHVTLLWEAGNFVAVLCCDSLFEFTKILRSWPTHSALSRFTERKLPVLS